MKKIALIVLCLCLVSSAALAEGALGYRFADAEEAVALLLSNEEYYAGMNQNDLDYRLQKKGATLEELKALVPTQMRDFTDADRAAIDGAMAFIAEVCDQRGYALPHVDDPDTLYTAEDAANFFDVFGRNTDYVIDPEETMADNFSFVIVEGAENAHYKSPEISRKIDAYLKGEKD